MRPLFAGTDQSATGVNEGPFGGHGGRGFGAGKGFGPRGRGAGGRGAGGRGAGGRGPGADGPDASDAAGWFAGRLPDGWFVSAPTVSVDRDEITVVGELAPPSSGAVDASADAAALAAAEDGRIARFREETREERIDIARQAEHRYGRHISWGARIGATEQLFTTLSVPVMTRLRQSDRQVLDTLIDAGVARSRSEALAWAVRLVGENASVWLGELRGAMEEVSKLRDQGPKLS
ncbi:hypothetical protein [Nakamurella antarctica]|uniref:hypothetical protein n=1 Tax=Nakamurella antarctica TaxID=1902245 RepID=UPI0019D0AA76|nr:hypothetical protein [Nakamurella antarctica]